MQLQTNSRGDREWKEVLAEEWTQKTLKMDLTIFFKPEFLETIAKTYAARVIYYLYEEYGQLKAASAFFSKSNEIITPVEFYYHPLWFSQSISESRYFEISNSIISLLKQTHRGIALKLDPSITDIRPFIWNHFRVENKFTYVNLNNKSVGKSVIQDSARPETRDYLFKVERYDKRSWELNYSFHRVLKFSVTLLGRYEKLFNLWQEAGYLISCNLYKKDQLIAAALVLVDTGSQRVFKVMVNKVDNEKFAHTYLNHYFLQWCSENNFNYIDFCGANIRNISLFKSRFGTTLLPYYKVYYDPYYRVIERITAKFSLVLKKLV